MTAKAVTDMVKWALPMPPDKTEVSHWRVGLLSKPDDYHCVLLASMGLNYKCISRQTGLTEGQVGYRLRRAGIRPSDYRSGQSACASVVIAAAARRVSGLVTDQLRQTIDV